MLAGVLFYLSMKAVVSARHVAGTVRAGLRLGQAQFTTS